MLDDLHESIIQRIKNYNYSPDEQKELDEFILKTIDKINEPAPKNNIITLSAPSEEIANTAHLILSSNGISTSLCGKILAVYLQ